MVKVLLLWALVFSSLAQASSANKEFAAKLRSFEKTAKTAGSPPTNGYCQPLAHPNETTTSIYSAHNRKQIELTVLSAERAQEVFSILAKDEENSFNFPMDGCYARAHRMAQLMDEMDIVSGKAFIEGNLYVDSKEVEIGWSYHVASLIAVKKNGKIIPTVIDPVLFNRPVPYTEWKAKLLAKPKSKLVSEYFTKRFNYDPDSRHDDMSDYLEDDIENMKDTIKMNSRLGDMLQLMEKKKEKSRQ